MRIKRFTAQPSWPITAGACCKLKSILLEVVTERVLSYEHALFYVFLAFLTSFISQQITYKVKNKTKNEQNANKWNKITNNPLCLDRHGFDKKL